MYEQPSGERNPWGCFMDLEEAKYHWKGVLGVSGSRDPVWARLKPLIVKVRFHKPETKFVTAYHCPHWSEYKDPATREHAKVVQAKFGYDNRIYHSMNVGGAILEGPDCNCTVVTPYSQGGYQG